tara:strand:- start:549 stop:1355 length:807 start_codon:yes stop_codon:yes gene_type:complete
MKFLKKPKKSLGQNFLIDQNIIKKIIKIENINKNSNVLEIGAGYGSLTKKIAEEKPKIIFAVEKDSNLVENLKNYLKDFKNIKIIHNDIFNIIKEKNLSNNIIVFGNLPYNISTQILVDLVLIKSWPPWYKSLILMFQKEVADRIIAKTKSKTFGRLSVLCNWRLDVKKHFDVSKNCFFPKPNVDSTILSFKPRKKNKFNIKNPKNLETVTRILFSNRRKMINKNFKKLFGSNNFVAENLNLNLKQRPEELDCDMFYKITLAYENLFN